MAMEYWTFLHSQLTWKCSVCTFENAPMRPGCEMCSNSRPEEFVIPDDYEPTREEMEILQKEDDATRGFQTVSLTSLRISVPRLKSLQCMPFLAS